MAKSKAKLDRSRPFATISSITPGAAYEQDGILFGGDEVECGKVEGYAEKKAAETKKERAAALAADKKAAADRATDVLGDLEDPQADAQRENAAAAAAEEKAAD